MVSDGADGRLLEAERQAQRPVWWGALGKVEVGHEETDNYCTRNNTNGRTPVLGMLS